MLDESLAAPLYKQLFDELLHKIKSGKWAFHQKMPTEAELCRGYGVSRMTVRLALGELQNQGYIYRKQGKGTFVKAPGAERALSSPYQFTGEAEKRGGKTTKKVLSCRRVEDAEMAKRFGLPPAAGQFYRLHRVHHQGGTPFLAEVSHIPCVLCPGLTRAQVEKSGLYRSLLQYHIEPDHAVETFEAVLIGEPHRSLLALGRNAPGFYLERRTYMGDQLVVFCQSWVRGDMIRYTTWLDKRTGAPG